MLPIRADMESAPTKGDGLCPKHLYYKGTGQSPYPYSLYNKSAEKARVIFRLRRSDIIAGAIVILKPCGFSDILFAP